jgi:hypothetical protein
VKLRRGISHRVNVSPGNYENVSLWAEVELDVPDATDSEEVALDLQRYLDAALHEDIEATRDAFDLDNNDGFTSYIMEWKKEGAS